VGVPACTGLGPHCRALSLTLRVTRLEDDTPEEQDAIATWLLGHSERIAFGSPYVRDREMRVDAVVHVPCRYLASPPGVPSPRPNGGPPHAGEARCAAHGFQGALAAVPPPSAPTLRDGSGRFAIVHQGRPQLLLLPRPSPGPRALPILEGANPCSTAPCRTSDNTRGAACCRDLTLDVIAPEQESQQLEDLLRSRKIPYLCKVTRADADTIECEVISACGYLERDGVSCSLHDRLRPDGSSAKPMLCSDWPDPEDDDEFMGHPGCVLLKEGIRQQPAG
jgi:hypothetical protein